jgi:peptidoglycan pentaglycine glycine transferase (the first glycine)
MLAHVTRNEEQWDAFTLAHGGGFLQSWGWSHFQEALGRETYRLRIDAPGDKGKDSGHEDTVCQALVVFHSLPLGKKYAYVPRGPIVNLKSTNIPDAGRINLETCIQTLRETARRNGAIFTRVEWPFDRAASPVEQQDLERWGFVSAKAVQPADTVVVNLAKDEADLLAAMHQKTRYNIRVAEKHGVTVREAGQGNAQMLKNDIDVFWGMLAETAARDSFHTHAKNYYATMFDQLSPKKRVGLLDVKLLFAEYNGEAIAACLLGRFGDTVTYLHGASVARHRNVMAPYLLHWEAMRQAKRDGYAKYDFWGVAPSDDAEHPWAGITRFKTGFGGDRIGYLGAWELPADPFWYSLYRYAKRFRNV